MLSLNKHIDASGVCIITLDNVASHPQIIERIIRCFALGEEVFLGHYRQDGFNLTNNQMKELKEKIPRYFSQYGDYQIVDKTPKKRKRKYLVTCRCPNDERFYKMLKDILAYYWQTVIFCPLIDWSSFVSLYQNYMSVPLKTYIQNGYTDFLFFYTDSGDFSIMFDSRRNSIDSIFEQINSLFGEK